MSSSLSLPSNPLRSFTPPRLRARFPFLLRKVIRGYLETVSELPWNRLSEETYDIRRAQLQLDKDHHGLDKVRCLD